jgi:hypothetical protein
MVFGGEALHRSGKVNKHYKTQTGPAEARHANQFLVLVKRGKRPDKMQPNRFGKILSCSSSQPNLNRN